MSNPPRPTGSMSESRQPDDSWQPVERSEGGSPTPRLWRSRSNRVFSGVLGGIAERFGLEALPLRILFVLFTLGSGGLLAILYLILMATTGEGDGPRHRFSSFRRSRSSKVIAGVVGGLSEKFGFDATLLRILYVVVSVLSAAFPGILVYLALWMFSTPDDTEGWTA